MLTILLILAALLIIAVIALLLLFRQLRKIDAEGTALKERFCTRANFN
jgi:hypothetical protein